MVSDRTSRREWIVGTSSMIAAATLPIAPASPALGKGHTLPQAETSMKTVPAADNDRQRRMKWWHEARFGMFIHWGLYSVIGRHEWVMENEGIPVSEYAPLAKQFKPKPFPAREWAKIARETGMRYMVMTTKHHEG